MNRLPFPIPVVTALLWATSAIAYPGGTPVYQTDAAPFCASCHSSRSADALAGATSAAQGVDAGPQYVAAAQARLALLVRAALERRMQVGFTGRMSSMLTTLQKHSGAEFVLNAAALQQFDEEWLSGGNHRRSAIAFEQDHDDTSLATQRSQ